MTTAVLPVHRSIAFGSERDSCRLGNHGVALTPGPSPSGRRVKWCFFLFLHHLGPFCAVLYLGWAFWWRFAGRFSVVFFVSVQVGRRVGHFFCFWAVLGLLGVRPHPRPLSRRARGICFWQGFRAMSRAATRAATAGGRCMKGGPHPRPFSLREMGQIFIFAPFGPILRRFVSGVGDLVVLCGPFLYCLLGICAGRETSGSLFPVFAPLRHVLSRFLDCPNPHPSLPPSRGKGFLRWIRV